MLEESVTRCGHALVVRMTTSTILKVAASGHNTEQVLNNFSCSHVSVFAGLGCLTPTALRPPSRTAPPLRLPSVRRRFREAQGLKLQCSSTLAKSDLIIDTTHFARPLRQ